MTGIKRKRVNLRIKQEFQKWLLVRILGTSLLAIIAAGILTYLYAINAVDADFLRFQTSTRTVAEAFWPVFVAASLTSITTGLLLALLLPARIAGPIYRVEQDLLRIGSGDLTKKVRLRSGDILTEHADAVNNAVEEIGVIVDQAKNASSQLRVKIAEGNKEEILETFEQLMTQLDRITTRS